MAVQERLGLVFEMFLKFRTVAKVMRVLNDRGLDLPRRDRHGDLRWARATISSVAAILKNPAYAGAFVYGRTRMRELAREGASRAKAPRPIEEWRIVVKDRYPAYVDWTTYEMIRNVIRDNRAEYMRTKTRGAPRDGDLLLHGIAWCARCGHKMYVRYKGGGQYVCNHLRSNEGLPACQYIRAARVDAVVADAFLTALAPAELDALSRAAAPSSRWIRRCEPARNGSSSASAMPPHWRNASSTGSTPIIVSSPRNSNAVGKWP